MVVIVLCKARPVTPLPETAVRPFGPSRFSDVENQESPRLQGSMCSAKQPTKRNSIIPVVEKVVEAFTQRSDGGAFWKIAVEKGCCPEGAFRHTLASGCYHGRRKVDSEHLVSSVHKAPCPKTATTAKVNDQAAGNAAASQHV